MGRGDGQRGQRREEGGGGVHQPQRGARVEGAGGARGAELRHKQRTQIEELRCNQAVTDPITFYITNLYI